MHASNSGRPSRLAATAALASLFVFAASANILPAILIRASLDIGVLPETLAQVASAQFAGFFLATLLGGILCDIFGKKHGLQVACLLVAAGSVLWTAAITPVVALAAGILMGMGGGIMESMSSALLTDLYPDRKKFFLNLSQIMFGVGAVGAPFAIAFLMPRGVPWQAFFAAAGLLAVALFLLYAASRIAVPSHEERIRLDALRRLLPRRSFLGPCLAIFCYVLSESSVVIFANLYLHKYRAAPESLSIYGLSLVWFCMTIGRFLCALVPEHHSYEKLLSALFVLSAVIVAAQALTTQWPVAFALFGLAGLAFSGIWPLIVGQAASRNPGYSGTVVGLTVAVGALGVVAAPPLMKALLAAMPDAAFVVIAVPLLVGAATVWIGQRPRADS